MSCYWRSGLFKYLVFCVQLVHNTTHDLVQPTAVLLPTGPRLASTSQTTGDIAGVHRVLGVRLRQVVDGFLDDALDLLQLLFKFSRELRSLPLLNHQHHPQGLPGLVRTEFIDEVVHVDKQQIYIFDFFVALGRFRCFDENVN